MFELYVWVMLVIVLTKTLVCVCVEDKNDGSVVVIEGCVSKQHQSLRDDVATAASASERARRQASKQASACRMETRRQSVR